jgi:hypothetical protein
MNKKNFKYPLFFILYFAFAKWSDGQVMNNNNLNNLGSDLYNKNRKQEAVKIWKKILKSESDSTRIYGMAANNISYKYYMEGNICKSKKYWRLIIKSNLKDNDTTESLKSPYGNYRHIATMRMASLYAKRKKFKKGLKYVYLADTTYCFISADLRNYIYEKVNLTTWKFKMYRDLKNMDMAKYILIERCLNDDYEGKFPKWPKTSYDYDQVRLAETLINLYSNEELKSLKSQMDSAFTSLEIKIVNRQKLAIFKLNSFEYKIPIYRDLDSKRCAILLKNSTLYKRLASANKN